MGQAIRSILVANRGEIACRIMRTAKQMGLRTYAVFSDADRNALHVKAADAAVHIGPPAPQQSYLDIDKIIAAAKSVGADAIHPGYGFLSENPDFVTACDAAGLVFIGPPASAMQAMALKGAAKALMIDAGVPVVPGYHGDDQSPDVLKAEARKIGLPVLIKAVAGGGGKGMRLVEAEADLDSAIESAAREGQSSFGNPKLLIEKYITQPRHIEIQVFADRDGNAVSLWERDCSLQRRHQKVVEEAPAPGLSPQHRKAMGDAAVRAARAIGYVGAGTVEFIADASGTELTFYFMEMNTRLQVEHPVTEMILDADLVAWQIAVAEGKPLPLTQAEVDSSMRGHAVEVRLYAEDPARDFAPQTGQLQLFDPFATRAPHLRIDSGYTAGDQISIHYDPMIAKVIAWGHDRRSAVQNLIALMHDTHVGGLRTNRDYLIRVLGHPAFQSGDVSTHFLSQHKAELLPDATQQDGTPCDTDILWRAAIAAVHNLQTRGGPSPFGQCDGFLLNQAPSIAVAFDRTDDRAATVKCIKTGTEMGTDWTLNLDGRSVQVSDISAQGSLMQATIDGIRQDFSAHVTETEIWISHYGQTNRVMRHIAGAADADMADGPGVITAPMPGKILSVSVAGGDRVEKGDVLLVLEAMKMEQPLVAPRTGIVASLTVAAGDHVRDGAVLCTITEEK